jgi:hypothetical protein
MGRFRAPVALAGFGMLLAFGAAAAPPSPNFSGRYFMQPGFGAPGQRDGSLQTSGGAKSFIETPPLKGKYAEDYAKVLESRKAGRPIGDNAARCLPGFALGAFANPYPVEAIQTKDQIVFLFEGTDRVRRIYTDGRGHPKPLKPAFYGHSIGHWEGDTLVVDTVGFRADTTVADGAAHSDRLHAVEHLKLVEGGKALQWDMSFTDPEALSAPFAMRYRLDSDPSIRMMEYACAENNRNVVNDRGETTSPG